MSTQQSDSQKGSLLGATLLIAGCCIGAGMLGLPVLTALAGFTPSLLLFLIAWLFMAATGLLWLEVNLWFRDEVSIVSMAERTLGTVGKWVSWATFLFLFYSLMVAYVTASGDLCSDFTFAISGVRIESWTGSLVFVVAFGILIYLGTGAVDLFNRILMAGLIVAYAWLVGIGAPHVKAEYLMHQDWNAALYILPAMVISFGYHNLVPSLTTYLRHDRRRLVTSILVGSFIPLVVYVIWEWLILGLVPVEGEGGFREAMASGSLATRALRGAAGSVWVTRAADLFGFFAIVTSFLSVALSFVDFLADGLGIKKDRPGRALLCTLTMLPPFVLALLYPGIFLTALSYAGAFGAVILFGILPALMVWRGRYSGNMEDGRILPGGRPMLLLVMLFAMAVAVLQLVQELGLTRRQT